MGYPVAGARAEVIRLRRTREGRLRNGGLLVLHERYKHECKCKSERTRRATQCVGILAEQLR
jgi:hypothetical protein